MTKEFAVLLAKNIITENKMPENIVSLASRVLEQMSDTIFSEFNLEIRKFCLSKLTVSA